VEARAIAGPFKKMISKWQIREISAKECEVEFFIDFEFNSIILEKILGIVFEKAATKMMECFEDRLERIS
jgi:coenzyme Q-binding protein COQ10